MKASTLGRHVREGVKNLGRNGWMTIASIFSVTITLLILGLFILTAMNVNFMASKVEDQVEISVFIDLTAGKEEQLIVEKKLLSIPEVESIVFVSKEEGIEKWIESMGEQGEFFQDFMVDENNPLPDIYIVKASNPLETEMLAQKIRKLPYVYKVNDGAGIIDKLFAVTNTVRFIGLVFFVGLAFTAVLLISNTIKITIVARRREIEIMRLVGATNGFIRWPFFIEGLVMGIVGATIPIVLLGIGYQRLVSTVGNSFGINFFELLPIFPLVYHMALLLLGIGTFIGIWGSVASVRRFLRV